MPGEGARKLPKVVRGDPMSMRTKQQLISQIDPRVAAQIESKMKGEDVTGREALEELIAKYQQPESPLPSGPQLNEVDQSEFVLLSPIVYTYLIDESLSRFSEVIEDVIKHACKNSDATPPEVLKVLDKEIKGAFERHYSINAAKENEASMRNSLFLAAASCARSIVIASWTAALAEGNRTWKVTL
jgi:hypothetical protein